jgi:hypothetical protein
MASGPAEYEFSPPPPAAEATVRRWDRDDAVIGLALVVLAISVFLPWFSVTEHIRSAAVSRSADGPQEHSYLWAVFALALIGLMVLVAPDAIARIPGNLPSAGQLLVGTSGLALALTLLAVATKPAGFTERLVIDLLPQAFRITVSVGWSYGGFIAVAAAASALITAFTSAGPLREASRAGRMAPASG